MKNILLVIYSVLIFLMLLLDAVLFAQAPDTLWTRTFGGSNYDWGRSVQQTTDGGYIVTGSTASFGAGSSDVWLIKTDGSGDTLWTKTFGGIDYDWGSSVQQTTDGGYIVTGATTSFGADSSDVWLIKTDGSGDTLWTKTFWGNISAWGNSVQQTSDGGYIITATLSIGRMFSPEYLWLIKTNAVGDTLWTKMFREKDIRQGGNSVQQTTDGGYIITGYYDQDVYDFYTQYVWLMKTDGSGDTLWTKTFGGIGYDSGSSVQQTTDGGYIIVGTIDDGSYGVWLIKTDSGGDTLWTKIFKGNNYAQGNSVQQTTDGGYVIIGTTRSPVTGYDDVWLIKTDDVGDTLWTKTFGGSNDDRGHYVQQTTDGGYIINGTTASFGAGGSDIWLIKVAPDVTAIEENPHSSINDYQLHQNYPNPFNPNTTIEFALPKSAFVTLKVYNLLGEEVATVIDERRAAGIHKLNWNARGLASGVYLYRLEAGDPSTSLTRVESRGSGQAFVQSKKLILMR